MTSVISCMALPLLLCDKDQLPTCRRLWYKDPMMPELGPPAVSLGYSRKDCVIFTFMVSWPLAIGKNMPRVVNVGRDRSPGWSEGSNHGPGTRHIQIEQPGWGETAHPRYIFCSTFCLQNTTKPQMSVTKKLKNKDMH